MSNTNTQAKLNSIQVAILIVVGLIVVTKALWDLTVSAAHLTYRLGRIAGHYYFNSKYYNPIVSEVVEAIEIEAREIKQQAGNFLCGYCLVASEVHSLKVQLTECVNYIKSLSRAEFNSFIVDSIM